MSWSCLRRLQNWCPPQKVSLEVGGLLEDKKGFDTRRAAAAAARVAGRARARARTV